MYLLKFIYFSTQIVFINMYHFYQMKEFFTGHIKFN